MPPPRQSSWDPVLIVSQVYPSSLSCKLLMPVARSYPCRLCITSLFLFLFPPCLPSLRSQPLSCMKVAPPMLVRNFFSQFPCQGCSASLGMVMDWREMAGRPTVRGVQGEERWSSYYGAWSGGKQVGSGWEAGRWDGRTDPIRGWVIAASWLIASSAEYAFCHA